MDLFHGLVMSGVRASHNHKDPNGVLVNVLLDELRVQAIVGCGANRKDTGFDFEVSCELLQSNLVVLSALS